MLFVNRLVHTLVPGSEGEPVDASCRTNAGFAASLICVGLNITLCLAKGIAGLLAGSVSSSPTLSTTSPMPRATS